MGLAKTLGEVAALIHDEVGKTTEGDILYREVSRCSRMVTGGVFDAVIDKGRPVLQDDQHAGEFGKATRAFREQMESLVFALKLRHGITQTYQPARAAEFDLASRQLFTAKQYAIIETGRFIDLAADPAVAARLMATDLRGEIEAAKASLERVRQTICDCIAKM
jgi:hypothetical protein